MVNSEFFIFKQNSALQVRRACETINLLACNLAKCSHFKQEGQHPLTGQRAPPI